MKKRMKTSTRTGLTPGSLAQAGSLKNTTSRIIIHSYGKSLYSEKETADLLKLQEYLNQDPPVLWVHVEGLARIDLLRAIGKHFNLHDLTIEDILNTKQRPRQETFEDYSYLACKALLFNNGKNSPEDEQISLVIGKNYLLTFSEADITSLQPLKKRLESERDIIRKRGPDYLAYSLIDIIVDGYFSVLEYMGERLEILEDELLSRPEQETLQEIHFLKREMLKIRQATWPLREALIGLEKSDSLFVHPDNALHMRDVYSHLVQIIEAIEINRDILSGMLEIYLSSVNNRLNEVMKILTMFAAIFIPLTLISGIYGMNFRHMPELSWYYGYPFAIGLMGAVALVMLIYFRRKKWL